MYGVVLVCIAPVGFVFVCLHTLVIVSRAMDADGSSDPELMSLVDNENGDSIINSIPTSLYKQNQRVYAKDEATGLLYAAVIRKAMWGPKSESSLPVPALLESANASYNSSDKIDTGGDQKMEEMEEEEDEDAHRINPKLNCYHYYVHYVGWNVKWDRWVEEVYLYDHSISTKLLADKIQKEYDEVKPKKKGQKMSVSQVSRWMKKIVEVELEHRRLEREGKLVPGYNDAGKGKELADADNNDRNGAERSGEAANQESGGSNHLADKGEEEEKSNDAVKLIIKEETLQKQAQLRERGLQLKRKRIYADRLHIPFTLKKILVEEWEVISQCGMLYDLPSKVSVRDALNKYLESKLLPMRQRKEVDNNITEEDGMQVKADNDEQQSSVDREKEWINMVEGIALIFDQALSIHLLFEGERTQYSSLRRQMLAQRRNGVSSDQLVAMKDSGTSEGMNCSDACPSSDSSEMKRTTTEATTESKPLPDRISEIYGCEHLLRLFIRLPAVLAATPSISDHDARRIFSKLGDLVRYLQKHQSELFKSTFRRPLQNDCRKVKKRKSLNEFHLTDG